MPNNYILLDRIELNATATSVTFDNIPQTGYTDLKVVWSARQDTGTAVATYLSLNGSTANFSGIYLYGSGASVSSGSLGRYIGSCPGTNWTANTFANAEFYIPNYAGSTNKSFSADNVDENNATSNDMNLIAGLWSNTAAITSMTIAPASGNFISGSTFSLYGIAKSGTTPAIAPKADGGNVIATDGTYWYHAFRTNGTFTPQANLTCDVLQVAGGGAGAWGNGGGGGAGGISYLTSQSALNGVAQVVTVGAGAARITTGVEQQEANGSNSQFASLTAAVGGGGGATFSNLKGSAYNGKAGGSGGGGGGTDGGASNAGGAGTSGQGNNGGNGTSNTSNNAGGGGGGAGAVGANGSGASTAGAGGAGTNTYSAWLTATALGVSNFIAGGGGGGGNGTGAAGGSGGGGAGGTNAVGTAGTANTGSGGGGGGGANVGANGGSGIVIIRYPVAS